MVSAKKNEANDQSEIVRNKDGSIRKPLGRKKTVDLPRGSLSDGNISSSSTITVSKQNTDIRVEEEQQIHDLDQTALVETAVNRMIETQVNEINSLNNRFDDLINEIRGLFHAANPLTKVQPLNTNVITIQSENDKTKEIMDRMNIRKEDISSPIEYEISRSLMNKPMSSRGSNAMTEICGYKMKIEKFKGGTDEDYDIWWEDLQAFFELYSFTEEDKVHLYNAHLGGVARSFIQSEDLRKIKTVEELHLILRNTFSNKYDWHNVLMNIKQEPTEKIRPYSVRLKVAARKCCFTNNVAVLDNMCVNYLKRTCNPEFHNIMSNCLPNTPYDVIVEHAIQFERANELKTFQDDKDKKPTKRKADDLNEISEDEPSMEKKIKQDFSNTFKQLKDQISSQLNKIQEQIRDNRSNSNRFRSTTSNRSDVRNTKGNVCFHCAKPNHNFNDCRSATMDQKNAISNLLKEKKFDFTNLRERAAAFSNKKRNMLSIEYNNNALNSTAPKQSGN